MAGAWEDRDMDYQFKRGRDHPHPFGCAARVGTACGNIPYYKWGLVTTVQERKCAARGKEVKLN